MTEKSVKETLLDLWQFHKVTCKDKECTLHQNGVVIELIFHDLGIVLTKDEIKILRDK